jgi:diguanylate cyclase (GGDEF)-like protein
MIHREQRTLDAVAAMAARLSPNLGCAILVVNSEELVLEAERNLGPLQRQALKELEGPFDLEALLKFGRTRSADVKPLITQAAEIIGAIVFFPSAAVPREEITQYVEEVCWVATLAIEQRHLLEDVRYRAHHDPLTHLWNRLRIGDEIDRVMSENTGIQTGLVLIGIDSFRMINDVLGCDVGNELLQQVAFRLSTAIDSSYFLARSSGDEFLILMPQLVSSLEVSAACAKLLEAFEEMFYIGEHELVVRASIGSATGTCGKNTAAELLNQANTALRWAKKRERGRASAFHPSMANIPPERLVMEQHIRFALQKREFELHFQPQTDLRTGELKGAEALLRWRHPWLGFISPSVFIPIAEEIGVIEEIGEWAIEEALRFAANWQMAGFGRLRMAVNVSGVQFSRTEFGASVARKLRRSKVLPEDLELEITESVMMTNFQHGLRQLNILRSLGVQIAVDDFGTGHSSLAYLQQLPIQRLKVDRMFVRDIVSRDERPPLLASIIQMSHALGLEVIVEGVETNEQALAVAALKCEEVQGYLIAKPMPAEEFMRWACERSSKRQESFLYA